MKLLKDFKIWIIGILIAFVIGIASPAIAQEFIVPDFIGGGVAFNQEVKTAKDVFPWFFMAHKADEEGRTILFTSVDMTPFDEVVENGSEGNSILGHHFRLQARFGPAIQIVKIGKFSLYGLGDVGLVTTGTNTTSSVGWGGFPHYWVKDWLGVLVIFQGERSPLLGTDMSLRAAVNFDLSKLRGQ